MHALRSGMDVKAYAASVGRPHQTVYDEVYAAEVAEAVLHVQNELADASYKALAAIRVAQRWLWPGARHRDGGTKVDRQQGKGESGAAEGPPDRAPEMAELGLL